MCLYSEGMKRIWNHKVVKLVAPYLKDLREQEQDQVLNDHGRKVVKFLKTINPDPVVTIDKMLKELTDLHTLVNSWSKNITLAEKAYIKLLQHLRTVYIQSKP